MKYYALQIAVLETITEAFQNIMNYSKKISVLLSAFSFESAK